HVDADAAEGILDEALRRWDPGPGLPGEEEDAEPEPARVDALPPSGLGKVERVRWRPVEGRRSDLARPLHRRERLALDPGPEGEHRRAEAHTAHERAPRSHVEAEERADQDAVGRTDADGPQDARVSLADPFPVVGAETEDGGPTRRATGSVDPGDGLRRNAEVVAERRGCRLRSTELLLGHDGEAPEIQQAREGRGRDTRDLPLPAVERASVPRVPDLRRELCENQLVARGGRCALDLG